MSGDAPDTGLYSIGQFSRLTGFSIKTLRHYDEEDVLRPAVVDEATGYRSYTETQRRQMHLLAELHFAGFPVEQMRSFMREPTLDHQGALFDWKIGQLEAEIQDLTGQLRSLRRKRAHPWHGQRYEVTVEECPSRPFVFLHSFTRMQSIEEDRQHAFETVRAHLSGYGMEPASPPLTFCPPTRELRVLRGIRGRRGGSGGGRGAGGMDPGRAVVRGPARRPLRAHLARQTPLAGARRGGRHPRESRPRGLHHAGGVPRRPVGHAGRGPLGDRGAVAGPAGFGGFRCGIGVRDDRPV